MLRTVHLFFVAASYLPALLAQTPKSVPAPPPSQAGKAGERPNPPEIMHWCSQHCATWTLDKGAPFDKPHYGSEAGGGIIIVERFGPDGVLMQRTDIKPVPGKATLTGKLSPDGNSIIDGVIEWTWHPCCGLGNAKYRAAWGGAIDSVPGNDAELAKTTPQPSSGGAAANADLQRTIFGLMTGTLGEPQADPATRSARIQVPPGAAPQFASLPSDIRAVLQQENAVLAAKLKLACAQASQETSPDDAIEIGKFAWRAAEYPRGYCWIKRSADLGNVRAKVLLGVAAGMGWGVPKDMSAAFQHFKAEADTTNDVWAAYFTEQCYENGAGTPVDKAKASRLDQSLMFRPEGQQMFLSIGADDAEVRRLYERGLSLLNPPVNKREVCTPTGGGRQSCSNIESIDQEKLQQDLRSIDSKYK